jgi:hypothetical protein
MGLQSTILEKAKAQVLEAFQNRVEKIVSLEELETVMEEFNFSIDVSIAQTSVHGVPDYGTGAAAYWKTIRKISEVEGVTKKEARVLYLRNKNGEASSNGDTRKAGNKPRGFGAQMSKQQKKYWRAITKIVKQEGCTTAAARQIYKDRNAA